jgi:heme-degrading monooxygenase HmoA
VVLWEFTVRPEQREPFERAYAADGDWARLFQKARGYLGTTLLRDAERESVYLTIDRWQRPQDYAAAMSSLGPDYQALDQHCEAFTVKERKLGEYIEQ